MSSLALITLGAREVQLPLAAVENLMDDYNVVLNGNQLKIRSVDSGTELVMNLDSENQAWVPSSARTFGEEIIGYEDWKLLLESLSYPMVHSFLTHIQSTASLPEKIWFIVTNQIDPHKHDTYALAQFIIYRCRFDFGMDAERFQTIEIKNSPSDIDAQYVHLAKLDFYLNNPERPINQLYLYPQGGIDAINTALLLRCLENEHIEVRVFQKPERPEVGATTESSQTGVVEKLFPLYFRHTLWKQRALTLLDKGNYESLKDLLTSKHSADSLVAFLSFSERLDVKGMQNCMKSISENLSSNNNILDQQIKNIQKSPQKLSYWLAGFLEENIRLQKLPQVLYQSILLDELILREKIAELHHLESYDEKLIIPILKQHGYTVLAKKSETLREIYRVSLKIYQKQEENTVKLLRKELERFRDHRNNYLHGMKGINPEIESIRKPTMLLSSLTVYRSAVDVSLANHLLISIKTEINKQIQVK